MDDSVEAKIKPYYVTRRAIKILGTYIGQNTMLPAIKLLQAKKLDLSNFFSEVIPIEHGVGSFRKLGLDLETLTQVPKQAMKLVIQP